MASTAIPSGEWTYERYVELDDDQCYEIIDGELLMTPAPGTRHQIIAARLFSRLDRFVDERALGLVLFAPTDIVLSDQRVVQPDVLFVSTERSQIIRDRAIHGAPDLVAEVLSPGSLHRDRHLKQPLYEEAGVREYWIVDPANRAIEVFTLTVDGYALASIAAESGQVTSGVLEGLIVDVEDVFAG